MELIEQSLLLLLEVLELLQSNLVLPLHLTGSLIIVHNLLLGIT